MAERYENAPILEAVIELRVASADGTPLADVNRVRIPDDNLYPEVRDRFMVQGVFQISDEAVTTTADRNQIGYEYKSKDGKQVVYSTVQGFVYSLSAPYDCWDRFVDEGWRLWLRYREYAKPDRVTRIAVRYINRIEVPEPQIELKDYLRTYPELSPDLPQALAGFFMQTLVPLPAYEAFVNITSALQKQNPESISVILDLDCFRETPELMVSSHDFDEEVRGALASLRSAKNAVFEACITDEVRRLIR